MGTGEDSLLEMGGAPHHQPLPTPPVPAGAGPEDEETQPDALGLPLSWCQPPPGGTRLVLQEVRVLGAKPSASSWPPSGSGPGSGWEAEGRVAAQGPVMKVWQS